MGLEIAKLRKKCNICNSRRAQRYCLRKGKDICWVCCNTMRIDKQCPHECAYTIQTHTDQTVQPPKTKIDSYAEHINLILSEIDKWTELPEQYFGGQIPSEMAQTDKGKKVLEEYVDSINVIPPKTKIYLRKKLNLSPKKEKLDHYEDIAMQFLDLLFEQEWEKSIDLMSDNHRYENNLYRRNYIKRRSSNRLLKRVNEYHLIISAIAETGNEALAYFEINGKYDLTIHFVNENKQETEEINLTGDKKWRIESLILGHPQIYYSLAEIERQISALLGQNKQKEAGEQLEKFVEILIDSKEIFALYGMYYAVKEEYAKANEKFLTSVEMDPKSYDNRYNFAFTSTMIGNQQIGKQFYEELLKENPQDLKILNNIAVIYLNDRHIDKALDTWRKCLEIDPKFELAKKNLDRFKDLSLKKNK